MGKSCSAGLGCPLTPSPWRPCPEVARSPYHLTDSTRGCRGMIVPELIEVLLAIEENARPRATERTDVAV